MREQLIQLIRATPFTAFSVTLKNGDVLAVKSVELIGVALKLFFFVDPAGIILHYRISSIHHLGVREDATI
jgi:hypothetical protein